MKSTIMIKLGFAALALASSACFTGGSIPDTDAPEVVGAASSAISRYALVCIRNTIDRGINYQIQWGTGAWESNRVEPGQNRYHSWRYAETGSAVSPPLHIRFDSDFTGALSAVRYDLPKSAATEESCAQAKQYQFEWDGPSHRFVDLKSVN